MGPVANLALRQPVCFSITFLSVHAACSRISGSDFLRAVRRRRGGEVVVCLQEHLREFLVLAGLFAVRVHSVRRIQHTASGKLLHEYVQVELEVPVPGLTPTTTNV